MIDKVNDEFIVDCTNNSKEERQQVYKFLVDNRNYDKSYLGNDFSIIVCNKKQGNTNWLTIHGAEYNNGKSYNVYTFEQFKEMYLEEEFILPERWCVRQNKQEINDWINNNKQTNTYYNDLSGIHLFHFPKVNYNHLYVSVQLDYKEITFEQFKKYVLKQETMEKEIIGYKLIKEYPNSKSLGYFEKYTTGKLSQYPEYWQPVYKEEFQAEVDDWVTCKEGFLESDSEYAKKENKAGLGYKSNKTFQIGKIYPSSNSGNVVFPKGYGKGVYLFALRKATKEEIEKASEQIVSMNGKFNLTIRNKKVFHQNEDITSFVKSVGEDWEHKIKNFNYNNYAFNVKDVILSKTGCQSQETYLSDWLKVYDLIK